MFKMTIEEYVNHFQSDLGHSPYVAVNLIIEYEDGIILTERSNPPYGWAHLGGFIEYGEILKIAAERKTKEQTNLDLENHRQFHTYSNAKRDPRFHTATSVFNANGIGIPMAEDVAKGVKLAKKVDLLNNSYAFDYKNIIENDLHSRY